MRYTKKKYSHLPMNIEIQKDTFEENPKEPNKKEPPANNLNDLKAQVTDATKTKEKIDPSKSLFLNMREEDLKKVRTLGTVNITGAGA